MHTTLLRYASSRTAKLMLATLSVLLAAISSAFARQNSPAAFVRHAPSVNGTVEGSVHQMLPEWVTLNSGASITDDLLVPGTPSITLNGSPTFGGATNGSGAASPTNYGVMLNSGSALGRLVRRTDALPWPTIAALPAPSGSASVTVNAAGTSINWSTLRNLTLNSNVGSVTVPAGSFGNFSANSGTGFVLGVAGATQPAVYNLQNLALNGNSTVTVVGPVVLNLANGFSANGNFGPPGTASWLTLNIRSGGLTLNSGSSLHGFVTAPSGTVIINGNARLVGGLIADRLTVNSGGLLRLQAQTSENVPPAVNLTAPANGSSLVAPASLTIEASASDADGSVAKVEFFQNGALLGQDLSAPYSFSINALAAGVYDFVARATDNSSAATDSTAVRVAVVAGNTAPSASPQNLSVAEDTPLPVGLTATDAEGNVITYAVVSWPTHGNLAGSAPNLVYTPNPDFHGADAFTFKAGDGVLDSAAATITITVTPVNDPAAPHPQSLGLTEDSSLPITLTATDVDGPSVSFSIISGPMHGALSGTAPNLVYTPFANFFGADSFLFGATDGVSAVAPAVVTLTVSPVNDAPVAQAASASVTAGGSVGITLLGSDVEGDSLAYSVLTAPAHGVLSGTAPHLTYTPSSAYQGADSFTYRVSDGSLDSASATVSLTVLPRPNTAPAAHSQSVATNEDTSVALTLTGGDAEADVLSFVVTVPPAHGTLSGTAPALVYSPFPNYHGTDSFGFRVNDGVVDSSAAVVSIAINPVNDAPVAAPQTVALSEDESKSLTLEASDPDGDSLTFTILSPPSRGTIAGTAPMLTYQPAPDFHGEDTFTYQVTDGSLTSEPVTVTFVVTPVNDAPSAQAESLTTNEDIPLSFTLVATDADGDGLTFVVVTPPAHGTLSGTAPNLVFTPNADYAGPDAFAFKANDGVADSATITVGITVGGVNDAPAASAQSITTPEDVAVPVALVGSDPDGDSLAFSVVDQPLHGLLSGAAPNLTYTPSPDFHGIDTFTFKISDGALDSIAATVTVTVTSVNDAPVAVAQQLEATAGTALPIALSATDVDGDAVSFVVVSQPTHGTLSGVAPDLIYVPPANFNGIDTFGFVANDSVTDSNVAAIEITVVRAAGAPEITSSPVVTMILTSKQANAVSTGFTPIELTPADVGSNTTDRFAILPTNDPARFGLTGSDIRKVNFDIYPNGSAVVESDLIVDQYSSAGVVMNSIPVRSAVYGGPASGPFTTFTTGTARQIFTFSVPVVAVGIVNTSPDRDTFEFFDTNGMPLFSTRDSAPDPNTDRFVGARVNDGTLIGAMALENRGGDDELDELIFEVLNNQIFPGQYTYDVEAIDPANDALTYSLLTNPDRMRIDSNSGLIRWIPLGSDAGTHSITVQVSNSLGLIDSQQYDLRVIVNQIPVISAGSDKTVRNAGGSVVLDGTAHDDGVPSLASFLVTWSQVSGPSQVHFDDVNNARVTATFGQSGIYILKLTGSDGMEEVSDTVAVRVGLTSVKAPMGLAAWWPANSHFREVVNGGHDLQFVGEHFFAEGKVGDAFSFSGTNFAQAVAHAELDVGSSESGFTVEMWVKPALGRNAGIVHWASNTGTGFGLRQWDGGPTLLVWAVDTTGQTHLMYGHNMFATGSWTHIAFTYERSSGAGRIYRNGALIAEQNLGVFTPATNFDLNVGSVRGGQDAFVGLVDELTLFKRQLAASEIQLIYASGAAGKAPLDGNFPPEVSAGPDLFLSGTSAGATLAGSVTDDGLPFGAPTLQWSVVQGPGAVAFADSASAVTTATFSAVGTYLLKLSGSDGVLNPVEDLTEVRVNAVTAQPPADMAAWWPANGHPRDTVSGGREVELINGAGYASGRVLQSFGFDGVDDFGKIPAHTDLNVGASASGFSIELWVRPGRGQNATLLNWWSESGLGMGLRQWDGGPTLLAWTVDAGGQQRLVYAHNTFVTGEWTHVAFTYDRLAGLGRIYRNGALITEQSIGSYAMKTTGDLFFGGTNRNSDLFKGDLDEIALYGRPLEASEIAGIFAAGTEGKSPVGSNTPPTVDAGPSKILAAAGQSIALSGAILDDGLPLGGASGSWTVVSAPGTVAFADASSPTTSVSFGAAGTYLLRLTASDGLAAPVHDVTEVRVGVALPDAAPGVAAWWPLNGHPREVVNDGHDIELFNGAHFADGKVTQGVEFDGVDEFGKVDAHPDLNLGTSVEGFTIETWVKPGRGQNAAFLQWGTASAEGLSLRQWDGGPTLIVWTIDTNGTARLIYAHNMFATEVWTHVAFTYDKPGGLARIFRDGLLVTEQHVGSLSFQTGYDLFFGASNRTGNLFKGALDEVSLYRRALAPSEIAQIYTAGIDGKSPPDDNSPPLVNAGSDVALVDVSAVASLSGAVTDDGKPFGAPAAQWSVADGPGVVTFAGANAAATTATFSAPGTYLLRLTASDRFSVPVSDVMEVSVATAPAAVPSGAAAWWPGNGHPRELIRGGHDIDLINGAGYAAGKVSQGFEFDGADDYGVVPAHADLNVGASAAGMTIEFWARPGRGQNAALLQWGNLSAGGMGIRQWDGGPTLYGWTVDVGGTTRLVGAGNVFATDAWVHIAFVHDRATGIARMYRNGVMVAEQNIGTTALQTSYDLYLGASNRVSDRYKGVIDEVTLYERPLAAAEVAAIYQAGAAGKQTSAANVAPVVQAGSDMAASVATPVGLTALATDDGLPNPPAAMTYAWTQVSGPGSATFSAPTALNTTATFPAAGAYVVRFTASDSVASASDEVTVVITTPPSVPPVIAFYEPADGASLPVSTYFELAVHATDSDGTIAKVEFFQDAAKLGQQTASAAGDPTTYFWPVSGLSLGSYTFTAKATDNAGTVTTSAPISITVIADPGPPFAEMSVPADDARISSPVAVTGVVSSPLLDSWSLQHRLKAAEGDTPPAWTTFATGAANVGTPAVGATVAVPGTLGTFDPTLLLNGIYEVQLRVTDTAGRSYTDGPICVLVEGNMKVGAFTLAFEDLKVPVAGAPISIMRTYDSRDSRVGDFGPGWHIAVNNVRVQKNRHLGNGWYQTPQSGNGIQFYNVDPIGDRLVSVAMPDGETHRFKAGAYVKVRPDDPDNASFAVVVRTGRIVFYPVGDTTATLEPVDASGQPMDDFWIAGTGDQDLSLDEFGFDLWNPTRFLLTTKDGTTHIVDEKLGLISLEDLNGNTLALNRDAQNRVTTIVSTQNPDPGSEAPIVTTVTIQRDATGRVDYIRDSAGNDLDYLYDTQGRLSDFINRELNTTRFFYENPAFPHYLTKILDPRGTPAIRTEFDAAGRLFKQTDADGKETLFNRGVDAGVRFEKIKDRFGHESTFYYDDRGNVTLKIDPLGAQTSYTYYPDTDRVKFESDHYGNVTSTAYDARGNPTVQTIGASLTEDPANPATGYTTRTTYNLFSAPTGIVDPDGRTQSFGYDPATNNLLTHTVGVGGPAPATTTYSYNTDGTLDTITDALGNVTSHVYDYAFTAVDYPGAVKQISVTVTDPAGALGSDPANLTATVLRTTHTVYDAQENLLAQITPRTLPSGTIEDVVTRYRYDAENRLKATLMPDGKVSETRYTSFGQTEKTLLWKTLADYEAADDSAARITSYGYDTRGNQTTTTYADGTSETSHFDAEGRRDWSEDKLGRRTHFEYDGVGRLRFTRYPDTTLVATDNPCTETVYDLVGRVTDTYDELRHRTTVTYFPDGTPNAGRRKESVQVLATGNLTTSYQYDNAGNVRFVTDPRGNTTETIYDDHGRPTTVVLPATDEHPATQTSTTFNRLGQRIATSDQEGKVTRYRYDGLGRLFEVRQYIDQALAATDTNLDLPTSTVGLAVTRYTFDEVGNQRTQTDAIGRTTSYEHDSSGRRTKRILPDTAFESVQYDDWGNLWKRTDFSGKTTTFGYDTLNRLKTKTADATHPSLIYGHAIARVEYDYDAAGQRTAARTFDATGAALYTESTPRDERGRLDAKITVLGTLDYSYYANSLLEDVVSSTTHGVNSGFRYDEANRLAYVDDASTGTTLTTGYTYNANGSLDTVVAPNGVTHTYSYDTLNRLRTLSVTTTLGILRSYEYQHYASGHRKKIIESTGRTLDYVYDGLYRLKDETAAGGATGTNGLVSYTLDKVGNREARASQISNLNSQVGLSYNTRDQLNADTYDANGNTMLSFGVTAQPDVYDFEDRLILRRKSDGSSIQLSYDADGIRVGKAIFSATALLQREVRYLVDGNTHTGYAQVVEEFTTTSAGTTLKTYTYGHDLLSVSEISNAQVQATLYFLYDGLASVRALTSSLGTLTDMWDYDAYGNVVSAQTLDAGTQSLVGISNAAAADRNAYLYRGEQFDADLGHYSLRARFYNQSSGRFWNQDTYEGSNADPASLHKYNYAHADPVNGFDPSGRFFLSEIQTVLGVIGNLARMAVPYINIYYRAQQVLHTVQLLKSIASGDLLGGIRQQIESSLLEFKHVGFNPQHASAALARNLTRAMLSTADNWGLWVTTHSASIDKILVYLPAPVHTPERLIETKVSIGDRKLGLKLGLVFGTLGKKESGRVVGFGVGEKNGKRHQMWRMDYHDVHRYKTSSPGEDAWNDTVDAHYNFHVLPPK